MPRTKKPAPENLPIETSGSVFLHGILEEDLPQARVPLHYQVGDIRLHNVPKKGERTRHQQPISFEGFIVASIWDGKKFRKLLLRKRGGVESTYTGRVERRERVHGLIRHLKTLVRRSAIWYPLDSGYEIPWNEAAPATDVASKTFATTTTPAATEPTTPPPVMHPTAAVSEAPAFQTTVTVTVEVDGHKVVRAEVTKSTVGAPKRRRRKTVVDENQLGLFPEEKAS